MKRAHVSAVGFLHLLGLYAYGMWKHPVETAAAAVILLLWTIQHWPEEKR